MSNKISWRDPTEGISYYQGMPSSGYLNSKINIMRGFDFDEALVALQNELHVLHIN